MTNIDPQLLQTFGDMSSAAAETRAWFASLGSFGSFLLAILVFLIGSAIAKGIGKAVTMALKRTQLDQKLALKFGTKAEDVDKVETGVGKIVTLFITLFVLLFAADIAGAGEALQPISDMLSEVLAYIPALASGILLAVIGYFLAKIARELVKGLLKGLRLDERLGMKGEGSLAAALSNIVFALILLLFAPIVLGALQLDELAVPVSGIVDKLLGSIDNILMAAVIFAVGYFIAKLVKDIVFNLLTSVQFDSVPGKLGFSGQVGVGAKSPASMVAYTVMAAIIVIFTAQALAVLEVSFLAGLSANLVDGFFHLLGALVVLALGLFAASLAKKHLSGSSPVLATVAKVAIITFTAFMALQVLGLATDISESTWQMVVGAICVAFGVGGAIALGRGGDATAKKFLEKHVDPKI